MGGRRGRRRRSRIKVMRSRGSLYRDDLPTIKVIRNRVYLKEAADAFNIPKVKLNAKN